MKRIGLFLLAALTFSNVIFAEPPSGGSVYLSQSEAYVILNGLAFYKEEGGSLKWKEGLVIGDRVGLTNRIQKFKIDGKEFEYAKIKSPSGQEGWARVPYLVNKSALAVVKADEAIVYSEPRDVKITNKTISNMTIVAVLQEGSTSGFSKIVCVDTAKNAYYTDPIFVSRDDLAFADSDVNATILYITATGSKNASIKANLYKVIEKRYSNSLFFEKIKAVLSPSPAVEAVDKPTVKTSGSFLINDNNVNVRAKPDEVNGEVLTQLNNGDKVEVIEVTAQKYTIGDQTSVWYRIEQPAGWVFGIFMNPAQ